MNTENTNTEATQEGITKSVTSSPLNVTKIYKSDYQKEGTITAEIKQTVTTMTSYPSKSVSNDMQDNVFGNKDFGFTTKDYQNVENRVAWIDVPADSTEELVKAKLASFPKACLYKVLSNRPILTDSQKYAIEQKLTTLDVIGARQVVRYPDAHPKAGSIVPDTNGKVQYRQIFFKSSEMEDLDKRTENAEDFYASAEILAEINEVGQSVI